MNLKLHADPAGDPHTDTCVLHVRELASRARQHTIDWNDDEKFSLSTSNLQEQLLHYVKDKEYFHCPADKEDQSSYSFNRHLEGFEIGQITDWFNTVMIYEGHEEELAFRHNGCAVVGLVNGYVRLINPEQAQALIWKP